MRARAGPPSKARKLEIYTLRPTKLDSDKMAEVTLKTLRDELVELRREISELKGMLISEPGLREEAVKRINEARGRVRKSYVAHEKVTREFLR